MAKTLFLGTAPENKDAYNPIAATDEFTKSFEAAAKHRVGEIAKRVGPKSLLHSFLTKFRLLDASARNPTVTADKLVELAGVDKALGSIPDQIWRTTEMAMSHSLSALFAQWGCWGSDGKLHPACMPVAVPTKTTGKAPTKCDAADASECTIANTFDAIAAASNALFTTAATTVADVVPAKGLEGLVLVDTTAKLRFRRQDRSRLTYRKHAARDDGENGARQEEE